MSSDKTQKYLPACPTPLNQPKTQETGLLSAIKNIIPSNWFGSSSESSKPKMESNGTDIDK